MREGAGPGVRLAGELKGRGAVSSGGERRTRDTQGQGSRSSRRGCRGLGGRGGRGELRAVRSVEPRDVSDGGTWQGERGGGTGAASVRRRGGARTVVVGAEYADGHRDCAERCRPGLESCRLRGHAASAGSREPARVAKRWARVKQECGRSRRCDGHLELAMGPLGMRWRSGLFDRSGRSTGRRTQLQSTRRTVLGDVLQSEA